MNCLQSHNTDIPAKKVSHHKIWKVSQTKNLINKRTKSWDKKQPETWKKFVPYQPTIFTLDCCRRKRFYSKVHYRSSIQSTISSAQLLFEVPREKDNTHSKNYTFRCVIVQLPKKWLAFCILKSNLVWEWVTRSNLQFSICFGINKNLNIWPAEIIHIIENCIQGTVENLAFFSTFCGVFSFKLLENKIWELSVIQTNSSTQIRPNLSYTKSLLCELVFWDDLMKNPRTVARCNLPFP